MSTDAALVRRIVANDLRLYWRGSGRSKLRWTGTILGQVGVAALLHLPVFAMLLAFAHGGAVRGGTEFACFFVAMLLFMAGLHRSLEVLYDRGDLPLLLSSPVPARVVLLTRLCDVLVTTLLATALFMLPLLDVAMFVLGAKWAWAWLAWFGGTLALAPLAVLVTLVAVRRIGARRARTLIQILGIVCGMGAFVCMQLPSWTADPGQPQQRAAAQIALFAWFDVPPFTQLAAAAAGQVRWLLALAGAGGLLFVAAWQVLGRQFVSSAQGAAGDTGGGAIGGRPAADRAWRGAFAHGPRRQLVRKELRVLRRDPLLLVRCSTQIISLVPMLVGAFWVHRAVGLAGFALVGPGLVAVMLAALMNANDEGHELVAASPLARTEGAAARTAAAALPLAAFGWAMAVAVLVYGGPWLALMTALAAALNAVAMAWLGTCTTRPLSAEERARNRPPRIVWQTFAGMLIGALGTAGIGVVGAGQWPIGVPLYLAALGLAALAFLIRPRPAWS